MAINDALPLNAVRRDARAKWKSFWGFESELQTNPMPFHLHMLWRQLMPLIELVRCTGDWTEYQGWVNIWSYFKPFVNRSSSNFWDNVISTLRIFQRRGPIVCIVFHSEDTRHLVSKLSKTAQMYKVFWLQFFRERRPRLFSGILLSRLTVHRLAKLVQISNRELPSTRAIAAARTVRRS